jgi:DNA-binding XRE family transcriptional regulator
LQLGRQRIHPGDPIHSCHLQFLGYDPFPPAQTLTERLVTASKVLGLSQQKVALSLGVDPGTLQSWEAEQHEPTRKSVELIERFLETFGVLAASEN